MANKQAEIKAQPDKVSKRNIRLSQTQKEMPWPTIEYIKKSSALKYHSQVGGGGRTFWELVSYAFPDTDPDARRCKGLFVELFMRVAKQYVAAKDAALIAPSDFPSAPDSHMSQKYGAAEVMAWWNELVDTLTPHFKINKK